MPQCPQCNKNLIELAPRCPTCQADLTLLSDYASHLHGGLERADNLTRAGELGQAVWAYLEVLEVDPDNPAARRQVSQVATAVRQFDLTAPGRRWAQGLDPYPPSGGFPAWAKAAVLTVLFVIVFSLGYFLGAWTGGESSEEQPPPAPMKPETLGGDR
jgi:hypothetical protein